MHLIQKIKNGSRSLTFWVFFLCVGLFLWNEKESFQIERQAGNLALRVGLTPVQRELFFDYPFALEKLSEFIFVNKIRSEADINLLPVSVQKQFLKVEEIPSWKGIAEELMVRIQTGCFEENVPLFEKIRQGQIWRFFSPCFLHRDLIHLLFNLSWLFLLGLQIEKRLSKIRMVLLIFCVGVFSNLAQYLVGGPYFLGLSGVVVGLVGFIWSRQKVAPRERYPLSRSAILFVWYFVMAMFALEVLEFALRAFAVGSYSLSIANTAHISGGLMGLLLGRCHFFARREI